MPAKFSFLSQASRLLVVSSFFAALATVCMQVAFDQSGVYHSALRLLMLVVGVSSNAVMWKFFLSANADADSSTGVSAVALGLNTFFSALLSKGVPRAAYTKTREFTSDSFSGQHQNEIRFSTMFERLGAFSSLQLERSPFWDRENLCFLTGIFLILLGVGLLSPPDDGELAAPETASEMKEMSTSVARKRRATINPDAQIRAREKSRDLNKRVSSLARRKRKKSNG
ncbi:unnamed protein product [Amoebophrya sp. A25]|nr:unnamed protein product [Amoebophrya sp. A25]|eukprot:GSA25T00022669001.1